MPRNQPRTSVESATAAHALDGFTGSPSTIRDLCQRIDAIALAEPETGKRGTGVSAKRLDALETALAELNARCETLETAVLETGDPA